MPVKRVAALIATAALAGGGVVAVAPAVLGATTASAGSGTTTIHLNAHAQFSQNFDKTHLMSTDALTFRRLSKRGKSAGAASFTCRQGPKTDPSLICHAAFVLQGGVMLSSLTVDFAKNRVKGTITGGDGKFASARGTVAGQPTSATSSIITLSFTT
jgi:hypothetical protein